MLTSIAKPLENEPTFQLLKLYVPLSSRAVSLSFANIFYLTTRDYCYNSHLTQNNNKGNEIRLVRKLLYQLTPVLYGDGSSHAFESPLLPKSLNNFGNYNECISETNGEISLVQNICLMLSKNTDIYLIST